MSTALDAALKAQADATAAYDSAHADVLAARRVSDAARTELAKVPHGDPGYLAAAEKVQTTVALTNEAVLKSQAASNLVDSTTTQVEQIKKQEITDATAAANAAQNAPQPANATSSLSATQSKKLTPAEQKVKYGTIVQSSVPIKTNTNDKEAVQIRSATTIAKEQLLDGTTNIVDYVTLPNLLHDYASCTYCLSLHAVPRKEYNELIRDNKNSGAKYTPRHVLISSAGRRDATSFIRDTEFNEDFYFEDFSMQTVGSESMQTRMTNAIDISFTIIEPYGVTLLNRLIVMAATLNKETPGDAASYTAMAYMIQIDFYGYADSGSNSGVPVKIPDISKFIPIQILSMNIKVGTKGAEYHITAAPFNHQAFSDSVITVPAQFEVTSGTVGDFFNSSGADNNQYATAIADLRVTQQAVEVVARAESEKQKYKDQADENGIDVRTQNATNAVYDSTINSNKGIAQRSQSINAKSFTAAYNAWLLDLVTTKKQATFDSISFELDSDIANAVITPPEKQPSSQAPMDPKGAPVTPPVTSDTPAPAEKVTVGSRDRKLILETAAKASGMEGIELACFMAQCEHETGGFVWMEELWDGKGQQAKYDTNLDMIAKLGNTTPGDGFKYRGRGFIQITGKATYTKYSRLIGVDILNSPNLASGADVAAKIAIKFWNTETYHKKTISQLAKENKFTDVTMRINGGQTGAADRAARYQKYLGIYGATASAASVGGVTPPTPSAQAVTAQQPSAGAGTIGYPVNIGKSIIDLISDVIRNSSYIRNQVKDQNYKEVPNDPSAILKDKKANALDWFKIIPEVTLKEWDTGRNEYAKSIVYRVIKYTAHNTEIPQAPTGKPSGAAKVYNYIFTGLNQDVISFNLDFDVTYYTAKTAMTENASKTDQQTKVEPAAGAEVAKEQESLAGVKGLSDYEPSMEPKTRFVAPSPGSQENIALDPTTKITSDLLRSILSKSPSLLKVELKIVGDPDFIKQDDLFYGPVYLDNIKKNNLPSYRQQRTENGSLIMDTGQVHCELYFQTPSDYNEQGLAVPGGRYVTSTFSGLYGITTVKSEFKAGKFEQTLSLYRVFDQPPGGIKNKAYDIKNTATAATQREQTAPAKPAATVSVAKFVNPPTVSFGAIPTPSVSSNGSSIINNAIANGMSGSNTINLPTKSDLLSTTPLSTTIALGPGRAIAQNIANAPIVPIGK